MQPQLPLISISKNHTTYRHHTAGSRQLQVVLYFYIKVPKMEMGQQPFILKPSTMGTTQLFLFLNAHVIYLTKANLKK